MASDPKQINELFDGALQPIRTLIGQVDSLAEKGISYMLSVVGAVLLIYLAVAATAGDVELDTGEFIALAASAAAIAVAGAGFRAWTSRASLDDAAKVSESALEIVNKTLDDAAEARREAGQRGS